MKTTVTFAHNAPSSISMLNMKQQKGVYKSNDKNHPNYRFISLGSGEVILVHSETQEIYGFAQACWANDTFFLINDKISLTFAN